MSTINKRIYLSPPHMSGGEMKYIKKAFDQNWIAPLGPNVDEFEVALRNICGVNHVAVLSSGTAAIHLALIILGVGQGDEVITSTFTFSATVNPILYQGARPVFVDSECDTWNMDPELLEATIIDRIKKGKIPKAIIPVHLYGMPAKMREIMNIAKKYDIPVIEDSAEALGSIYNSRPVGSIGKFGILSFNGNKIITTSGGGALISDDKKLIEKSTFLASQARDPAPHYQHSEIGYNYRMSNVLAGIGLGQLEALSTMVNKRRSINKLYRELLSGVPGIEFQTEPSSDFFSNYWLTCILIDPDIVSKDKEKVRLELEANNIESRPLWKPMHLQPVFSGSPAYTSGISEEMFNTGLCLPSGSGMTETDFEVIAGVLKQVFHL